MKNINFKAWPELTAFYPSTIRIERATATKHPLFLDFSGCREISSTGLTVWLLRILSFIKQSPKRREYSTELFSSNEWLHKIKQLSFFHHLNQYAVNCDMHVPETEYSGPFKPLQHYSFNNREVISYPIFCLDLTEQRDGERRDVITPFRKTLMELLIPFKERYNFNACQFITIISEMLKNSADHTNEEAFCGLDIVHIKEEGSITIHFVFGDLGAGIKKDIQNYMLPSSIKKQRISHMSFSDTYHYALTRGFTTKPDNEINKGIGMSLILEGGKKINMELSVFDAFSRCLLSSISKVTHEELRKFFYPYTKDQTQPFYYYGVIKGENNDRDKNTPRLWCI